MIHLTQCVVVEGKYDKIRLASFLDATIFTTDGFGIFKNKEKRELLRIAARQKGLVVVTDSDQAGNLIRAHLKNICADGEITHVFVPQLRGKERRKAAPSKEGFLGVEGLSEEILLESFRESGVLARQGNPPREKITKSDLFAAGLSGGENSAALRQEFCRFFGLPQGLSANGFLDLLNTLYNKQIFESKVEEWHRDSDKK